jgi:hypothetical protein
MVCVLVGVTPRQRRTLHMALRPVPQPVALDALVDTGANVTCYDSRAVKALQLRRRRFVIVNAPALGGWGGTRTEEASLTIVHPSGNPADDLVLATYPILELPLGALGYQMLLGRDVLAHCRLDYDGRADTFALEY